MIEVPSILFVHAHPDDETIGTGGTMALYARSGARVTLVTCTLGEEGEIFVPAFAHLAAEEADQLGGYRISELREACQALGVTDYRFLGGAGAYRDSGMLGTQANDHPRAFWRADLAKAASELAMVIDEVQPQVVVTYDENGQYGHPDHIQAHRVTLAALEKASWKVAKLYYTAIPRSAVVEGADVFESSSNNPFAGVDLEELPFLVPDNKIAARVNIADVVDAKRAAVEAHATQIAHDSWIYVWATGFSGNERVGAAEHYVLARGEKSNVDAEGYETDLFAGLFAPDK